MRAVWWRELRELALPGLGAVVAFAALGAEWATRARDADRVALFGVVGGGLGLFQGLLDRRRRDDGFLLHRPISAVGIHGARSLAGLAWLLLGAVGFAAGLAYERHRWASSSAPYRDVLRLVERGVDLVGPADDVPRPDLLVLFALVAVAAWAAARFGVARRRPALAVVVTGAAVLGTWSFVARTADVGGAIAVAGLFAVFFASWTLLDLAGDRR